MSPSKKMPPADEIARILTEALETVKTSDAFDAEVQKAVAQAVDAIDSVLTPLQAKTDRVNDVMYALEDVRDSLRHLEQAVRPRKRR